MSNQSQQPKDEKEKKKKRGLWIIWLFASAIVLMVLTPFLLPSGTSSSSVTPSSGSSATTSTASSDASSTSVDSSVTPSSSETPSSSDVTSTSSVPTSSEDSSSSTSSETLDAPRLSQLSNLNSITFSLKNGVYEYFIWEDGTDRHISAFNGETLLDTTVIGLVNGVFITTQWIVPFNDGLIFTLSEFDGVNLSDTTVYYTHSGVQASLDNTNLIQASGTYADDGIYLVTIVAGSPELHLIDGLTFTPVKLMDLEPGYSAYNGISDVFQVDATQFVDLTGIMYVVSAIDFANNFAPIILAYSADTDELLYSGPLVSQTTSAKVTKHGIFEENLMTQTVTHYSLDGGESPYPQSIGTQIIDFDAYIIEERVSFDSRYVYVYYDGTPSLKFYSDETIYIVESTADKGFAYITTNLDQTSFTLHAYEDGAITSTGPYAYTPEFFNRAGNNLSDGAVRYQTLDGSSNTITHYIQYDNGWQFYEVYGDVADFGDARIQINDTPYVIDIPEVTSSNKDSLTMTVYNGAENTNTSLPIVLENYDLLSVQVVGFVEEYMLLNLYNDTLRTSQGLFVNLSTGTFEDLPESIWYLAPQLGEPLTSHLYLTGNVLSAYTDGGAITFDITDIDGTFESTAALLLAQTHVMWLTIYEDHFGVNEDLVMLFEFPNVNPTNVAELTLLKGDITGGFSSLTEIHSIVTTEDLLNTSEIYVTETLFLVYDFIEESLTTLVGPTSYALFYVQNDLIIAIEPDFTETVTTLLFSDFFSAY